MMNNYKEKIFRLASKVSPTIIDFSEERERSSPPTLASSEFITKRQQGDWAENVILKAVNEISGNVVAVKYGKSDDIIAGEDKFKEHYEAYQQELDTIGKRPDILLFNKDDYEDKYGLDISKEELTEEFEKYVSKALAGIEVRSSSFLVDKYNEEEERIINHATQRIISLKEDVLGNYLDLLEKKQPALIPILRQMDPETVKVIYFKSPVWRSSSRLVELGERLREIRKNLKVIHGRTTLSITPKVEDFKVVYTWIMKYGVPHYYVQVFFDKIYGISYERILELISDSDLEGSEYFIGTDTKNQNKKTIKIPITTSTCIGESLKEPNHHSVRKELSKGRLLFYVAFDGGEAFLDKKEFDSLFRSNL
ncbi:MAG: AccI family restriction endonuclease [Muribaculaceae bacterium]|nr:AccI family restriction endonuclease [Muribaculaceae bacterium]